MGGANAAAWEPPFIGSCGTLGGTTPGLNACPRPADGGTPLPIAKALPIAPPPTEVGVCSRLISCAACAWLAPPVGCETPLRKLGSPLPPIAPTLLRPPYAPAPPTPPANGLDTGGAAAAESMPSWANSADMFESGILPASAAPGKAAGRGPPTPGGIDTPGGMPPPRPAAGGGCRGCCGTPGGAAGVFQICDICAGAAPALVPPPPPISPDVCQFAAGCTERVCGPKLMKPACPVPTRFGLCSSREAFASSCSWRV